MVPYTRSRRGDAPRRPFPCGPASPGRSPRQPLDASSTFAILVSNVVTVAVAFGVAYWAFRARHDRSAFVGLYLLFGIPGGLLLVAGLATLGGGDRRLGGLLLGIGLGFGLPLLRPVRQALARVLPIDADSPVDMTGLCLVLGAIGFLGTPLLFPGDSLTPDELTIPAIDYVTLIAQAASFVLIAYAAVGWRVVRTGPAATERLGIVPPDPRTVGLGVVAVPVGLVLAGAINLLATTLQPGLAEGLDAIVDQMTEQLQNPLGALLIGVSAGAGEEAIFRGALQPRYGIALTSLLFALVHAPQYGLNLSILGLVALSILLGLLRKHINTTAAMIAHALYNAVVVMLQTVAV